MACGNESTMSHLAMRNGFPGRRDGFGYVIFLSQRNLWHQKQSEAERLAFSRPERMPHGAANAAPPPGVDRSVLAKFAVPEAQHTRQAHGESLEQLAPVRHAA